MVTRFRYRVIASSRHRVAAFGVAVRDPRGSRSFELVRRCGKKELLRSRRRHLPRQRVSR